MVGRSSVLFASTSFFFFQCFTPPQTTQNVEDRFAQFIVHAPVIGSNILPVGNSPSFLSSAFDFEFMAVAEIGAYHVLYLVGSKLKQTYF